MSILGLKRRSVRSRKKKKFERILGDLVRLLRLIITRDVFFHVKYT